MFNNRFNSSKNDPLLEAVKAARADGDARRLAESMANDLFGVYSRKAVVREYLSDYDYALEEAYKCMKEEDKMADKDYDRDGKIETSKKEVWGSRLRAAKASGKYKGPVDEDSSDGLPPSDAAKQAGARQQAQTPSSTPARTGNAAGSTISNARAATGMNEEEQIDEISKELAGKYIKHADYKRSDSSFQSGKVYGKELATKRRTKQDVETSRKHNRDAFKREKGINTAVNKLTGKAKVAANEEAMNEAAYSAKAAREGKDIGKPGKMFSKIAKKAGEKYGSEERGKKVAGAILAKIRAKHMKEDSSFNAAQDSGKSAINEAGADATSWAGSTFGSFRVPGTNFGGAPTQSQQRDPSMKGVMSRLRTAVPKPGLTAPAPTSDTAPKPAPTATKTTPSKSGIVSKAELQNFQKFNPGATLGQYMNTIKGKTAVAGGRNDPTSSRFKADKTQGGAKWNPNDIKVPSATATASASKPAATPAPAMQNPDQNITKAPMSQSAPEKAGISQEPTGIKTDFAKTATGTDTPRSLPASSAGSVSVNPEVSKAPEQKKPSKEAGSIPAAPMAESYVAVGANKYRIV